VGLTPVILPAVAGAVPALLVKSSSLLVASVVFGRILSSLLLLVVPATYAIIEDMGIQAIDENDMALFERSGV
jgi:hypothetical protein